MIPTKKKVIIHGNDRWQLDFGIDAATGKRRRVTYETEKEADDEIERLEEEIKKRGAWWARLTEAKRAMVSAVYMEVEAAGQTLSSVWEDWQRWKRDNQQQVTTPKAYEDVVAEWARVKIAAGADEKYIHDSRGTVLDKFGVGREKQNIHEITAAELEKWINSRCKIEGKRPESDLGAGVNADEHFPVQRSLGSGSTQRVGLAEYSG